MSATTSASPGQPGEQLVAQHAPGTVQPISLAARRRGRPLLASAPFDEVLTSAKAGFPSAFEHLFSSLSKPLAAYFRSQGAADPAGSANDVLARVFRGLGRFQGDEDQFRAWVFTIARNSLIDERRRSRRRIATLANEPGEEQLPEEPDAALDALSRLGNRDAVAVIQGLVPDQREVLLLRIIGDLTVEQVAAVVGKRPGAVKALQRRGLAALRRKMLAGAVPL